MSDYIGKETPHEYVIDAANGESISRAKAEELTLPALAYNLSQALLLAELSRALLRFKTVIQLLLI